LSRRVRPLEPRDLPDLLAVQRACYGEDFIESAAVFARRLACPANCSLAVEQEGRLVAYLAAYRSVLGKVTPLHGDFEAVPAPDTLYLHDMAVHPALAGQGLARALLAPLLQSARTGGLRHTALVSVQDSQAYWARQGYARRALHGAAQQHLATYGSGAVYMAQVLQEQ
jgi:ribosomal protein S18 acetylase RimI-like enzyme